MAALILACFQRADAANEISYITLVCRQSESRGGNNLETARGTDCSSSSGWIRSFIKTRDSEYSGIRSRSFSNYKTPRYFDLIYPHRAVCMLGGNEIEPQDINAINETLKLLHGGCA